MPRAERVKRLVPEEIRHQLVCPANAANICLAINTSMIGVEVHEPQRRLVGYAHVRDLSSAQETRRVSASAALAPCSPPVVTMAFQVATNAARREGHMVAKAICMMDASTASRHFVATLGSPRPRRSDRNGIAVPRARRPPVAGAVVLSLCRRIRCSRIAHEPNTWCAAARSPV